MATETVVAVYPTFALAQAAVADLQSHGIPRNAISYYTRETSTTANDFDPGTPEHKGFWASLFGSDNKYDRDYEAYDSSVQTGDTVVTVFTDLSESEYVGALLDAHNPIDLDTRSGYLTPASTTQPASVAQVTTPVAAPVDIVQDADAILPLHEEHLEVGKKVSQTGVTKVRRFVTERAVSEQIALRDERVVVHRRVVTGVIHPSQLNDAFTEKTIEVVETAETPVVQKVVQKVEEVVIGKAVNERVATVEDVLRKEHVDVTETTSGKNQI